MTTAIQTREEVRITREEARRARIREARIRQARRMVYLFLCWLQEVTTDLPGKVKRGAADLFTCMICLILMGALFFACLGLLELAFTFWGNIYFG